MGADPSSPRLKLAPGRRSQSTLPITGSAGNKSPADSRHEYQIALDSLTLL